MNQELYSADRYVFKQPLYKKILLVAAAVLFVVGGMVIIILPDMDLVAKLIGLVSVLFFGYCGVIGLTNGQVVMTASRQGVFFDAVVAKEYRTLVPWSNIKNFAKVTVSAQGSKHSFLAVYLNSSQALQSEMAKASNALFKQAMSDGGVADLYVSNNMLPMSVDKTIAKLEEIRLVSTSSS